MHALDVYMYDECVVSLSPVFASFLHFDSDSGIAMFYGRVHERNTNTNTNTSLSMYTHGKLKRAI